MTPWTFKFELIWACRTHRHNFPTETCKHRPRSAHMTLNADDVIGTAKCRHIFFISDPALSLANKSSFTSFWCILRVRCVLQMNPGTLLFHFLLLASYVPNVAKRSIWDQCKKYILRTDPPATDQRLTSHLGKFQMAISPRGVVRSTLCLVLRWGFRGRQIEWRYFRFRQIQDGGSAAKIQMAISPRRIIWFTLCLVLGRGFRGWRIEWR